MAGPGAWGVGTGELLTNRVKLQSNKMHKLWRSVQQPTVLKRALKKFVKRVTLTLSVLTPTE